MEEACKAEIIELHQFFERWFRGETPAGSAGLERLVNALADEFRMISPNARIMEKGALLEALQSAHGRVRNADPPFRIRTERIRVTSLTDDVAVATYEEWQEGPDGRNGRLSSAVFRWREGAANRVEWVHLHETWLERS